MKHFILTSIVMILISCSEQNSSSPIIDASIKEEAKKHFSTTPFSDQVGQLIMLYKNDIEIEYSEDGQIVKTMKLDDPNPTLFKSNLTAKEDTLIIGGLYGLWGGSGFRINLLNEEYQIVHLTNSDEFPSYSNTREGEYQYLLKTPCKNTKLILSKEPSKFETDTIFGYIEFESEKYFASPGSVDGKELGPRKEISLKMKAYFQTKWVN